jgi:PGF-CTERM protein
MTQKYSRVATAACVFCLCLAACLGATGVAAQEAEISVGAEADDSVSPGGRVTVDVTAQDTGSITVSNVPSSWSVSSSQNQRAFVSPDGPGDQIQDSGTVLWAWADDRRSSDVSVTFGVSEDAQPGEVRLGIEVENGDGDTASDTVTVTVGGDGETTRGGDGDGMDDDTGGIGTDNETETGDANGEGDTDDTDGAGGDSEGLAGFGALVAIAALVGGFTLLRRRSK